jgi:hypothetical protein
VLLLLLLLPVQVRLLEPVLLLVGLGLLSLWPLCQFLLLLPLLWLLLLLAVLLLPALWRPEGVRIDWM